MTPTPHAAIATPMPRPATVPRLKNAWKSGIRVRPKACSTEAASTLIITSVAPNDSPIRASPTTATGYDPSASTPSAATNRPIATPTRVTESPRRAPQRATMTFADMTPMSEPAPIANSSTPTSKSSMPRFCLTAEQPRRPRGEGEPAQEEQREDRRAPVHQLRAAEGEEAVTDTVYRIDSTPRRVGGLPFNGDESSSHHRRRRARGRGLALDGIRGVQWKDPVSDATRRRVTEAAARLGYTGPDPRAASLRRGRSGIVGVVVGSTLNHLFLDPVQRLMMDGLAEAVAPFGAGLLLLRSSPEIENAPTLLTVPVDAAVLIGCDAPLRASLETAHPGAPPIVVIEGDAGDDVPRILLDNREAQRTAAAHLRGLGHTDVAIVTLRTSAAWSRRRMDRARRGDHDRRHP